MSITCITLGVIFIGIGITFFVGKAIKYIDGYQKMSDEEKRQICIKQLCQNIGLVIGIAGIDFLLAGFIPVFKEKAFIWYMIAWLVGAGLDVRYIAKSKRYIRRLEE